VMYHSAHLFIYLSFIFTFFRSIFPSLIIFSIVVVLAVEKWIRIGPRGSIHRFFDIFHGQLVQTTRTKKRENCGMMTRNEAVSKGTKIRWNWWNKFPNQYKKQFEQQERWHIFPYSFTQIRMANHLNWF